MITPPDAPSHVVVDGSNIATEGRSVPSLAQLNDAVLALVQQYPTALVTVVVDATFGHRIDPSERAEFDEGIANNELVAPPAGAVGRGDAFVLGIAAKAGAAVLSNDSFQEFHGQHEWLFDSGRLIGGKPVPHVGWVFVERSPVRGPVSRKATRARRTTTVAASPARPPSTGAQVNEVLPFLEFAERHPAGSVLDAVVDSYASHGAYVTIGDVRAYLPLRLMGQPPPKRARDLIEIGQSVTVEVREFSPARRSIDCALVRPVPHVKAGSSEASGDEEPQSRPKRGAVAKQSATKRVAAKKSAAKQPAAKKSAAKQPAAKKSAAKQPAAKKSAAKKATMKHAAAKKTATKKAAAKKVAAKQAAAKRTAGGAP